MKLKKIILFLALTNLLACSQVVNNEDVEVIDLNIKDKKLHRFFSKSSYYRIKGISDEDSSSSYKFKINNDMLSLKLKNRFISGFQEGVLFDDSLAFYLHDLNLITTKPLMINFNAYKKKKVNFLPLFTKENLELLKNRSSKIYKLDKDGGLIKHYVAEEYLSDLRENINEIVFHKSTLLNIDKLKGLKLFPKGYDSFFIIHNPITDLYTLLPDFNRFGLEQNNVLDNVLNLINVEEPITRSTQDTTILSGIINIDKTTNFNNGHILLKGGAKVYLDEDVDLIFNNCTVFFDGLEGLPIEVVGNKNNSLVFNDSHIRIEHSSFNNLSNFDNGNIKLPSAITFYNSEALIKNSKMINNLKGDDYINFYNSSFSVESLLMEDVYADAIDSDFSVGTIDNLIIKKAGNDGLDFSGSEVLINNSFFYKIGDKALSVGESSKVRLENSSINNSELAVVVKDGSTLTSTNNLLENNKVDFSVFFKKDFYPPPYLNADFIDLKNINLFQKGVILQLNILEEEIKLIDDVESLLYGKTYGKASE